MLDLFLLLAAHRGVEHDVTIHVSSGTHSASWALVLFCFILGLMVALSPVHRTSEIKRAKE